MQEKNTQEQAAAVRQSELLIHALERAQQNGGVWLNPTGKTAPRFYPRGVNVSPFNAMIMALHSDENSYKTNQYTLFSEAKKRGESVQTKEKGVPFNWYNWNEYVNKQNPEEKISREQYKALDPQQQSAYKGIRTREVRALFNIDQTTLPFVNKEQYEQQVKEQGSAQERDTNKYEYTILRSDIEKFLDMTKENLVAVHLDGSGMAHYDNRKDAIYMPEENTFETYEDYVNELMRQVATATGNNQRLARGGMNIANGSSPEDIQKQERFIVELAAGSKMLELGLPAKLSPESMKTAEYWQRELKENPCLIDAIEMDLNNSLDMIHKAERGEKVELSPRKHSHQANEPAKHYYVTDELKGLPNKDTKEFVVVRDYTAKKADVVLPAGASLEVDNEIPGMNKARIEKALQKEGFESVTFYNIDGALGYRPDDSYFADKEASVVKLNQWELRDVAKLDVSDAVKRSGAVTFDKVLMLRDDEGHWALFMKPENEASFSVYPSKQDVNKFFTTMKQGVDENADSMRQEMASMYYVMASKDPSMKKDLFKCMDPEVNIGLIERVNIFKTKEKEGQPSKIFCMPTVQGEKLKPREITQQQWQRIWLADDMQDYKTQLAASLFADVLRKGKTESVGLGTDKSEQEAQAESKQQALHTEFHEENDQQEQKQEEAHAEYHEEKDKQAADDKKKEEEKKNSPEQKEKERQEEKAKEEATKAETKAVAAVVLSPMLRQFLDLKKKHPDALLLFRCGDFYETYKDDAEKASKILGITLTKSSKTRDENGQPLKMAGFPYHALDTYLPKLIRAGQRVAICDQIEAPKENTQRGISSNAAPDTTKQKVDTPDQEATKTFHR